MKKGKLIIFEGGEGCGKTTISNMVYEYLTGKGIDCIKSREPGGVQSAEDIRNILFNNEYIPDRLTEILLFEAARREHFINVIRPALDSGKIVILDRFTLSTYVYQGLMNINSENDSDVNLLLIRKLNNTTTDFIKPDITLLLDIEPKIALGRIKANNRETNRNDLKPIKWHENIRKAYLQALPNNKNNCIINANKNINEVFNDCVRMIERVL